MSEVNCGSEIPRLDFEVNENSTICPDGSLLTPLRTILELKASHEVVDVFITRLSVKAAHSTLSSLRSLLKEEEGSDLQHLRRFAKAENLPTHVRSRFSVTESRNEQETVATGPPKIYLLICSTTAIESLVLRDHLKALFEGEDLPLWTTTVPRYAPTSNEQAALWTQQYWPAVYKRNNPFGPHPAVLARAGNEIQSDASQFIGLAHEAALQAHTTGVGEAIGVVVVDRVSDPMRASVVAVAGDARWKGSSISDPEKHSAKGNIMAHAALRAIGMVAAQLCKAESQVKHDELVAAAEPDASIPTTAVMDESRASEALSMKNEDLQSEESKVTLLEKDCGSGKVPLYSHTIEDLFYDQPLTDVEQTYWDSAQPSETGYLCNGLEIYLTHEPCVMCSMAINHSRFAKVVFERRMPKTGGYCSEKRRDTLGSQENAGMLRNGGGLGHGLFWRKELNWSLLAWQWRRKRQSRESRTGEQTDGSSEARRVSLQAQAIVACDGTDGTIHI